MGDILQPTLVLPIESWKEEHLRGSLDRGVVRGERQRRGVWGVPLELLDVSFECKGGHGDGGGEETEVGESAEVGLGAGGRAKGGKSYVPTAEGTRNHPLASFRCLCHNQVTGIEEGVDWMPRADLSEDGRGNINPDRLAGLYPGKKFLLPGQPLVLTFLDSKLLPVA